jgi:hypothetical protein
MLYLYYTQKKPLQANDLQGFMYAHWDSNPKPSRLASRDALSN